MFEMAKTLIVVYKDEMLMNQLKKMVESKDDVSDAKIVGTRDASINIVAWTEKVWLGNKRAGNIKDKVLFLGDIKKTDELIPVVDVKFDAYGVKYGWAGNQAVLFVDPSEIRAKRDYVAFIEKLADLPVPDMIKKPQNVKIEEADIVQARNLEAVENTESEKAPAFLTIAKEGILQKNAAVEKFKTVVADRTSDFLRSKSVVKRQMLFYGVVNLYRNGLEEFMNL